MYLLGTSIPADRNKAIEWPQKAAAAGFQPSIKLLPLAMDRTRQPLLQPGGPQL
jgi:TPR repeat protein